MKKKIPPRELRGLFIYKIRIRYVDPNFVPGVDHHLRQVSLEMSIGVSKCRHASAASNFRERATFILVTLPQ